MIPSIEKSTYSNTNMQIFEHKSGCRLLRWLLGETTGRERSCARCNLWSRERESVCVVKPIAGDLSDTEEMEGEVQKRGGS